MHPKPLEAKYGLEWLAVVQCGWTDLEWLYKNDIGSFYRKLCT